MDRKWRLYEKAATYLLNQFAKEFGLQQVEGKQKVQGTRSGTTWTIDAKGVCSDGKGFVIVECRRYTTSKQNQEKLGSLAYRIIDTGAEGAVMVSPLGLQEGAAKIAAAENIINVQLDANSTPTRFAMQFLSRLFMGIEMGGKAGVEFKAQIFRKCSRCGEQFEVLDEEKVCPTCRATSQ